MDLKHILDGLVIYFCLLPLLTLHEFAHAWVAWKCGDDTARLQGRVTVNPLAHMDLIGTVILPLITLTLSSFAFGWGKPVPVNVYNLRHRRRDDTLVSIAGPGMNFLIGIVVLLFARTFQFMGYEMLTNACLQLSVLSLVLCFFNLIPIPPLDGSHLLKNLIGMRDETYYRISQYGFILVIILIQIPLVSNILGFVTFGTVAVVGSLVGLMPS
jgi:Zn-dependent protease